MEFKNEEQTRMLLAFCILIIFILIMFLTYAFNQPKYTPADKFDPDNLDKYDDGDKIYIKDVAARVEYEDSITGSMMTWHDYRVTTGEGFVFYTETYSENEEPNIKPGTPVVVNIEIEDVQDTGVNSYNVGGKSEVEFVMTYNSNWLIIPVEGAIMFFLFINTLMGHILKKLKRYDRGQFYLSFSFLYTSIALISVSSILTVSMDMCYMGFAAILFIPGLILLYGSIKDINKRYRMGPHEEEIRRL